MMSIGRIRRLAKKLRGEFAASYSGPSVSKYESVRKIEAALHELAHAAVFGMDPFVSGRGLSEDINNRFARYQSTRSQAWADRSECAALAVELIVVRSLGLPVNRESLLLGASEQMERFSRGKMERIVTDMELRPISKRRAEIVVGWVERCARERAAVARVPS